MKKPFVSRCQASGGSGRVHCCVRVRPATNETETVVHANPEADTVEIFASEKNDKGRDFKFDCVFPPSCSQNEIFEQVLPSTPMRRVEASRATTGADVLWCSVARW